MELQWTNQMAIIVKLYSFCSGYGIFEIRDIRDVERLVVWGVWDV